MSAEQQQIAKGYHTYEESRREYAKTAYTHQEFPKWKYHPNGREQLIGSPEEEKRLGPEWTDKRVVAAKPLRSEADLLRENEELKKQLAALKKEQTSGGQRP